MCWLKKNINISTSNLLNNADVVDEPYGTVVPCQKDFFIATSIESASLTWSKSSYDVVPHRLSLLGHLT